MTLPQIFHRFVAVDGVRVFYREAGPPEAVPLLLLHGFPSASHQFRRLFDALGARFRLIAPDYPGFGYSDAPAPASTGGTFTYTFDRLADVMEEFCIRLSLRRFALYVFDFGGPVGFRIASRRPEWIAGVIVQNANSYDEGLSPMARQFIALGHGVDGAAAKVHELLTLEATKGQYLHGVSSEERIAPDGWTLDQHFLDRPGRKQIQVDLALDYHTNLALYPTWQAWLRRQQPPLLVLWGRNDPFFLEAGGQAYLKDVPSAELHLFETGHFALEEYASDIAPLIAVFLERVTAIPAATG
jgi:pimeloyl-ACP methyl ester carboxylesterase